MVYKYLKEHGEVSTQKEFGLTIGKSDGVISKAMNGDGKALTENIFQDIFRVYKPVFNYDWLINGEGEMIDQPLPENPRKLRKKNVARRNKELAYSFTPEENEEPVIAPEPAAGVSALQEVSRSLNDDNGSAGSAHSASLSATASTPATHLSVTATAHDAGAIESKPKDNKATVAAIAEMYAKAQSEMSRVSAIRKDTENANREVHAILSELAASRAALDAARADLLSTRNDLQQAVTVMRQLVARITRDMASGYPGEYELAAEPAPDIEK